MKVNGKTLERPQHMWLRVAVGIHGDNFERVIETYDLMSQKFFTHATPTLFNAGTPRPQLSSCFLNAMESDSIDGIYNTLKECALISKHAGGIGLHIHNVRATGSHIRGTNGTSNGIVPMLRVFNNTAKYVDQCLHPESIIYTTHGPKQIRECSTGETEIFNMKGEHEVIKNVLEHAYEGEFLEVVLEEGMYPLRITPEHPVYVSRDNRADWIEAKNLLVGDSVITVQPTYTKDVASITEDDCYMYGLLLRYGKLTEFCYELYTPTLEMADWVREYLNRNYVEFKIGIDREIVWNSVVQLPFRHSDLYNSFGQKKIHYRWLNLPVEKSKHILIGVFP
jgi:hypothetical protein